MIGTPRTGALMAGLVVLAVPLTVAYLLFPARHTSLWAAIGLLGVAAMLVGVRRNRPAPAWPWAILAAASLAFTAGDTTYNLLENLFNQPNPFPSPADVFYLLTYPLYAVGLYAFTRYRRPGRDLANLLDALILTLALALFSWRFLIDPLASAEDTPFLDKMISIAYPLGDVLVLALLLRLLVPGGARSRAVQLLVLGSLGLLVSDVLYGYLQLQGTWQVGSPMDLGWVVFFLAWGLAALHPSMVELTEPMPPPAPGIPRRRLALLGAACLVAPGMLAYEAGAGRPLDAAVLAAFAGVMFLLVLARLGGVMADHRRAVGRERGLRVAAGSLVSAISPREVAACVDVAATALFGRGVRHSTLLLVSDPEGNLQAMPTAGRPWVRQVEEHPEEPGGRLSALASGKRLVSVEALGPALAADLGESEKVLLCPLTAEGPRGRPLLGMLLVAGSERRLLGLWGALESLSSQVALALERVGLSREIGRRNSEAYFRTLVHNTSDVILIVNDDDTVRYASPSADGMFGTTHLPGTPLDRLLHPDDRAAVLERLARIRAGGSGDTRGDWRVAREEGDPLDVEVRCSNLRHENTVHALVLTLRDVTEQRKLERELTHRAFHDPLTGLPNRVLLLERIERALLRGRRDATLTGVLFIDLDDFKIVNDTMGHSLGDELLTAVARRLTSTVRRSDTAARLGGDEFAVLIEGSKRPADTERLAGQVVQALSQPFRLTSGTVNASASVGIATSEDSADSEELLGHADLALYAAKTAGKRQWRHYRRELHSRLRERHELQAGLDSAIAKEAFALRYQPIVQISSGDLAGFEALVRWPHERRGLVAPDEFITLAEETGHIMPLGAWVLARAASDVARWQQVRPRAEPVCVNVNVSARQFRDGAFLGQVRQVLDTSGLAPRSLILELTESAFMRRDDQVRTTMSTLKDLGVSIAIDDFGTGFSSLSYLRDFPIDMLKVDKSFIDHLTTDAQQVALVEGIVRIADVLGLQVVAEGIEERGQRDLLAAMGCHFGQGYLYAHPMTSQEGERLLLDGAQQHRPKAPSTTARHTQQRPEGWAIRRDPRWGDLSKLWHSSPMVDAVIDEVDGRRIRCGNHWLTDFASCNYLGFDLDPEIIEAIGPQVRRWGTHPSWSRLIGNPNLYPRIEERLAGLLGAPDALVLPTISLIHQSVIPVLAGEGHVFVEAKAHRTVYDGCVVARGHGASVQRFHADRPDQLDALLHAVPAGSSRLVCLDGVNSMTGNCPDLAALVRVCREHGALLYVDDAHGFGVIGERRPDETSPYGCRGNSIIRHIGESYEGIVLVGGFSKAYSSLLAFLALPTWLKEHLKVAAAPYLYSGPSPTASLATVLAGMDVNDRRGDALRGDLYRRTAAVLHHLRELDVGTPNTDGLPIIEIPLGDAADLDDVSGFLWDRGVYVTLAAYPLVPRDQVGFRVQITASNTDEQIEELNATLTDLARRFPLRPADDAGGAGTGPRAAAGGTGRRR
ncbi:aminotransferase class I/II-fold pyridoxal phosphate-dependent enzyme [Streptomyces sp. RKND-216]|uniref:aminotransferase class I/II-fold pyridoxal phosphate-dependent enzyme n=1 Tax=Streptomyces sp. RKND-216 TaxID=2562581 RepID=UPI0032B33B6B